MTLSSIFVPDWITYGAPNKPGGTYHKTIGLHRSCSSSGSSTTCIHFPTKEDCMAKDRYFCSMWRSIGFLMSFAAVLELATIVAYMVVIGGGKQKRETGWKVLCFMLVLVGVVQCAGMSIVVCFLLLFPFLFSGKMQIAQVRDVIYAVQSEVWFVVRSISLTNPIGLPIRQRRPLFHRLETR
jgi:hypothetical protein